MKPGVPNAAFNIVTAIAAALMVHIVVMAIIAKLIEDLPGRSDAQQNVVIASCRRTNRFSCIALVSVPIIMFIVLMLVVYRIWNH